MRNVTPLRYPGGKALLGSYFAELLASNRLNDGVYGEPFAGGAGVAMSLLLGEHVDSVHINDIDSAVWAFWRSLLDHSRDMCDLIRTVPLTATEWQRQKEIYRQGLSAGEFELGFATFYLNRTNRSGILNGGIIGGKDQSGPWKIDARFNRDELCSRVRRIARYKNRIYLTNDDAVAFLSRLVGILPARSLLYLDPPYYVKGQHLYRNYFSHEDHELIASTIQAINRPWVVSYDDHKSIRSMYKGYRNRRYTLGYSAADRREGSEIMFFAPQLAATR